MIKLNRKSLYVLEAFSILNWLRSQTKIICRIMFFGIMEMRCSKDEQKYYGELDEE